MRTMTRMLLLCGLILPAFAGNRILQVRDSWALSSYEKVAIQRSGYDYAPTVIYSNGTYRMWWCGSAPSGNSNVDHIWTAESGDGLNWTNQRVALRPAPLELICDPTVVRVGGVYWMYFTGTTDRLNGTNNQVYLATSLDGEVWRKYPDDQQPVPVIALPTGVSGYGIGQPSVVYRNGRFWLYYTDSTREGGGTFLASSLDGVNFRSENGGRRLLATNSVDVKYSTALGLFIMVHGRSHDKLYFSSSTDGIQWETSTAGRYLAQSPAKNKSFEGCLAGSEMGTIGTWTFYYYASHQGTPGLIQEPLSWDIEVGRLAFSLLPAAGTVFQFTTPFTSSRDHFYDTQSATPLLYDYELRAFAIESAPRSGFVPFFRLYHPTRQDHFYTADPIEKSSALTLGFLDEGALGYVSVLLQGGTIPLYRLYHSRGDHFYTVDAAERDRRKNNGYRDEGIAGYVWPADLSGQPASPRVSSLSVFGDLRAVLVEYDTSGVAGAFDTRLEVSAANQGFRFSNPSAADPMARISQRLVGNSGSLRLSTEGFPAGRYQVRIAALDEAGLGLGRYSESRSFNIGAPPPADAPPFGFIDLPQGSASTDSSIAVEGWALDDQGVTRVEVFIDGRSAGVATRRFARPDVRQVYPSFPDAESSGYRLETNVSQLATGSHLILVEVTDTLDQKTLLGPRVFNVLNGGNGGPFGYLDLPVEGAVAGSILEIGGWTLDDRGIGRVELWVNGAKVGEAFYGALRPDVAVVFPGFPNNPRSGFVAGLITSGLTSGTHRLTIRMIDNQGLATDLPARTIVR